MQHLGYLKEVDLKKAKFSHGTKPSTIFRAALKRNDLIRQRLLITDLVADEKENCLLKIFVARICHDI